MKIINLKSNNIKGIKAIDITPKENVVVISGKNGAGKTSALDSIWYILKWKEGAKQTPMPIRKGEKEASGQVTLKEDLTLDDELAGKKAAPLFIVDRVWKENGKTELKVTGADGTKYPTPQKLLDEFIGYLSFDPREYSQMLGRDQRKILIDLTGFDITEIEKKIAFLFNQRLEKGREVKLLSGNREEITIENLPEELISVDDINDELQNALMVNSKIEESGRLKERAKEEIIKLEAEIVSWDKYLGENQVIPIDSLKEKLTESQGINEQVRARDRNRIADSKEKIAKLDYTDYTRQIDEQTKIKIDGLKENWHKIPDQKLSLTEEGIAYDGTPYSQIAFSEQLKIAIKIAMALNPKLRVIRIADYSLLDNASKDMVRDMAKEFDYQVWAEEVDETGTVGFYIEEGEIVAEENQQPF